MFRTIHRGFTLIEVLVAVGVFALVGVILLEVSASSTNNVLSARLNSYATWIAENKLTQLRLEEGLPATREYKEDIEYGTDEWRVVTAVQATENPDIHRVEVRVSVRQSEDNELSQIRSLTGFIGRY